MTDAATEADLIIGYWQREALRAIAARMAAEQDGDLWRGLTNGKAEHIAQARKAA